MKVLHVIWNLGQGGAQKYLLDLLKEHNSSISSRVLVLSSPGPLTSNVENVCDGIDYVGMKSGRTISAFMRLIRYLKTNDFDVIHSHSNNTLFNIALHFQYKPVIYTEHGGRLLERAKSAKLIYTSLRRPIHRYIAISRYMRDVMQRQNPIIKDRISVVYNGIDVDGIAAIKPLDSAQRALTGISDGPNVGFVGRMVYQKGVDNFIEVASCLHALAPEVKFVLVGDGPKLLGIREMIRSKGLENNIHILGYQKDVIAIIKCCNVLLFTSRYEPFGLVLTEAMAAGIPVVAFDREGAVSEIIVDGKTGFLVKSCDTKEAAERVLSLLESKVLRNRFTDNALKRVASEFSMKRNAKMIMQEYTTLAVKSKK